MSNETARLFNSTLATAALAAVYELGFLDELNQNETAHVKAFCDQHDLNHASISFLLHLLQRFEIVELSSAQGVVRPGPVFSDAYRDKGYFLWLVRGYGNLWQNLSTSVKNGNGTGDFIGRNGKCIAMASRDYGSQFVDPYFTQMLTQMPFQVAADLGCGSAERLIALAKKQPDFRGIGIDINTEVVKLAQQSVEAANLQDRIAVICGDVRELKPSSEFSLVEVLFCFFMGHDLWPRSSCLSTLRQIRAVLPRAKRFLLCDTYRSELLPSDETPIFTLGFETTHAVMGQYIPSVSEWMDLFAESEWTCVDRQEVGIPFSAIFDLR